MNSQTTKRVTLALGVASVATSLGNVAVKAGPALQTLNNLTNTADYSINNTYGQSFSVDGIITATVVPFAAMTSLGAGGNLPSFNAQTAVLVTGFSGSSFGGSLSPVSQVTAFANLAVTAAGLVMLNATGVGGLSTVELTGVTATQTIGASISSTLFGPSTVKATTSFTNQLINDLSAF
ncbi:MAG: hypothetical protein RLZZ611_1617 [Cyanobacteriota bacterium]|jgi:hypothetical protein